MELSARIAALNQELIELRRDFHRHPELGFREERTADRVESYLRGLGLEVRRMAGTGVVGLLKGGASKKGASRALLLRADIDALPVQEENDLPWRSANDGVMHACGHDAHTAMLLVAARVLTELRQEVPGRIKFVFQPNEETTGSRPGAEVMIEEGVLEDPRVDAAMAQHVWTSLPAGRIGVEAGPVTAALDVFTLKVRGKGGHTGFPEETVDPILAAASIVQGVQAIQTREISPRKPTIIMFGRINGGTKSNIVPDLVTLEGSLRYSYEGGEASAENPEGRLRRVVQGICAAHRVECELELRHENRAVINDPGMAALARRTAEKVLGEQGRVVSYSCTAGEDFSEFTARVPGVMIFLGAGNPQKGSHYPQHNPRFDIDEDVLPLGVHMHVLGALNYLKKGGAESK